MGGQGKAASRGLWQGTWHERVWQVCRQIRGNQSCSVFSWRPKARAASTAAAARCTLSAVGSACWAASSASCAARQAAEAWPHSVAADAACGAGWVAARCSAAWAAASYPAAAEAHATAAAAAASAAAVRADAVPGAGTAGGGCQGPAAGGAGGTTRFATGGLRTVLLRCSPLSSAALAASASAILFDKRSYSAQTNCCRAASSCCRRAASCCCRCWRASSSCRSCCTRSASRCGHCSQCSHSGAGAAAGLCLLPSVLTLLLPSAGPPGGDAAAAALKSGRLPARYRCTGRAGLRCSEVCVAPGAAARASSIALAPCERVGASGGWALASGNCKPCADLGAGLKHSLFSAQVRCCGGRSTGAF
jgi:hypothetical protein